MSDNGALKAVGELDESDLDVLVNSPTGVEFEMDGLNVHFLQNGEVAWFQPGECVRLPSGSVHCQYDHPFGGTSRKAKLKPIRARPPAVRFVVKQIRIPAVECGPGPASVRILYGPSGSETVHSGAVANCEQRGDRTFCRN